MEGKSIKAVTACLPMLLIPGIIPITITCTFYVLCVYVIQDRLSIHASLEDQLNVL